MMYADFATGIVVGTLLGVFVSATLWAVLFSQVQAVRRQQQLQEIIAGGYAAQMSTPAGRP